jgi:protein-tyrosine phosphatase
VSAAAHILTVCTGNVCRSPFIERVLQAELDASWGAGQVEVTSAGTGALAGHPMEARSRRELEDAGYSADGFIARSVSAELVAAADLVLTATRQHRGDVALAHPKALRYTFTLLDFADLVSDLPPETLAGASGPADARNHVRHVIAAAAARRGLRPPLAEEQADVADPFRLAEPAFARMSRQVLPAVRAVAAALARPRRPQDGPVDLGRARPR